ACFDALKNVFATPEKIIQNAGTQLNFKSKYKRISDSRPSDIPVFDNSEIAGGLEEQIERFDNRNVKIEK
ncbi:MAG: hypothetical protein IKX88_09195, partial [Thermoguttaceae bacterium]|nr:hypothetical protein [Thermoguttaceae bacterium]